MYRICLGTVKARASANVTFQIVWSLSRFNALHAWWYVGYMTPSIVLKSSKLVGPHRCSNNVLMKNCSRYFVETLFTRPITYVPPRWRTLWLYYGPCKSVEMAGLVPRRFFGKHLKLNLLENIIGNNERWKFFLHLFRIKMKLVNFFTLFQNIIIYV